MFEVSEMTKRILGSERSQTKIGVIGDSIRLNLGEPDFTTPSHIQEAAVRAMKDNYTHYMDPQGDMELREAICSNYDRDYGVLRNPEDILITAGAIEAINIIFATYMYKGDEVLIMDPEYSGYAEAVRLFGGKPVFAALTQDLRPNFQTIASLITKKTRMIILSNPCNPTGQVMRKEEIMGFVELAQKYHLILIVDEAYHKILYNGLQYFSICQVDELRDQAILVNSFSKTYAMTGWRVGYIIAPRKVIQDLLVIHRSLLTCANAPAQRACVSAIKGSQNCIKEMIAEYDKRRRIVQAGLKRIELLLIPPCEGTFYFFPMFKYKYTSREMTKYLAKRGVLVRSGTEYGENGQKHFRISFATSVEMLEEGIDRLKKALYDLD